MGKLEGDNNAFESDIIISYIPAKKLTLKLLSFVKISEYDCVASAEYAEKKMNNISMPASYIF